MEGEKEGRLPNLSFLPVSDQSKQQQKKRKHRSDAPNPDVVAGAKAVWERMRQLEASNVVDAVQVTTEEIASAIALLESPVLREAQARLITERYQAFVESIDSSSNEWRAVDEYVREGESTVNEYLTWRPDNFHIDPTDNYEWQHDFTLSDDEEDDPDLRKLWRRPEQQLFYLYGLLDRGEPQRFYPLKIQVLELNGEVEVLVESLELLPQPTGGFSEAENSLLRLIRNNIA